MTTMRFGGHTMRKFKLPAMTGAHAAPVDPKVGDKFWMWGCGHLRNQVVVVTRLTPSYFYFTPFYEDGLRRSSYEFRARRGQQFPVQFVGVAEEHYACLYPDQEAYIAYSEQRRQEAHEAFWAKRGRSPASTP